MTTCAEICISGYVQGVGYRMFAKRNADNLGLKGYAANLRDGRVKILVMGQRADVERYVKKLREGPRLSTVRDLSIKWVEHSGDFDQFVIR
jgi:acylphosphatase